jgi:hypothetical protein
MKVPISSHQKKGGASTGLKPPVKRLVLKNTGLRKLSDTEVDIMLNTPVSMILNSAVEKDNAKYDAEASEKDINDSPLLMEDVVESLVLYILVEGDDTQFNDPTDKKQRHTYDVLINNFRKNKTDVMNEFRPLFEKIVDTQMDSFAPFARCIEIFKMGMSKIDTTSKPLLREQVEDARHVAKINNDEERQVAVQEFDNKWKWDLAKKAGMMLLSCLEKRL